MSKHSIDYSALDSTINKKSYRLEDVKDRIQRVAFDVVRFKDDDNGANLWQIQSSEEGDYIVSLYDNSGDTVKTAAAKEDWEIVPVRDNLQFFYKGDPILKAAASNIGLTSKDMEAISRHLPKKLAGDKNLIALILNQVDKSSKQKILNKYPELA
jgi:hypothetical protein